MTPEERFERMQANLESLQDFMSESFKRSEKRLDRIEEDLEILAQVALKTGQRLAELAESQKETGERLNILIGIVERYFSNGEKK